MSSLATRMRHFRPVSAAKAPTKTPPVHSPSLQPGELRFGFVARCFGFVTRRFVSPRHRFLPAASASAPPDFASNRQSTLPIGNTDLLRFSPGFQSVGHTFEIDNRSLQSADDASCATSSGFRARRTLRIRQSRLPILGSRLRVGQAPVLCFRSTFGPVRPCSEALALSSVSPAG
jgi:hypothetical protein